MNDYLKNYRMEITALSPIHVGSGVHINKKEYIYMPWNHKVIIPDIEKMYTGLMKKGLEREFINYMTDVRQGNLSLSQWLGQHGCKSEDYEKWEKYSMDAGEAFTNPKSRPKEIISFVKDSYGMPYIPGSSIKGMFRTALMALEIKKKPDNFEKIKTDILKNIFSSYTNKIRRDKVLAKETQQLEQQIFYILNREEKKITAAVNDAMACIRVSDSRPLNTNQLTLSQKIDLTLSGDEKKLPLLRETLIPGSKIHFDVSIDTSLYTFERFPYQIEDIMNALNIFNNICHQSFYSRFKRGSREDNIVWIGGGCGFSSKTIMYSLFKNESIKVIDGIYKMTLGKNYYIHKHNKDLALRLAPHVCKCTRYGGELYDMGMGRIAYSRL